MIVCHLQSLELDDFGSSTKKVALHLTGFFDSAPQQIGSYDDCQDLTVAHYCLVNYKTPWTNWYPLRTGLCIPINCTGDDLAIIGDKFLPNMTTIHLTAMCVPKTPEPMETGAYVVLSILGVIAGFSVLAGACYSFPYSKVGWTVDST
jgi:hypothetical protein